MLEIILAVLIIGQPVFGSSQVTAAQLTAEATIAPAFRLRDLRGASVRLSDYRGKVVLLNFWATWCAPCQAEMPALVKLQNEYASRGLQIIGIACPPERRANIQRVSRKFRLNYPVLFGTREITGVYGADDVLPVTVIVDRDGRVRGRVLGILESEEFREKVEPLFQ